MAEIVSFKSFLSRGLGRELNSQAFRLRRATA